MALQFLTIAFNQLLEWKISPLHKYDINIIIPPPSRRPILLREYIWCSKDGNQSDFSCSPTYLCFSLTDWLLPSTHSHATPSPRLDTGARASRRAHSHTDTQREAGTASDADSERSVCRGWQRLVFSLRSSLTLTHRLASTLSQTCGTAAFAWRCHSSLCRSYDGRGKRKKRKKKKRKKRSEKKKAPRLPSEMPSFLGASLFCHLSTSPVAMSGLLDIFLEENTLLFPEPVVSGSSPHLTLGSPPLLPQSISGACGNRLWHSLILDPLPRAAGSQTHTWEEEK